MEEKCLMERYYHCQSGMKMNEMQKKFMEIMHRFRHLNLKQLITDLSQGEFFLLTAVQIISESHEKGNSGATISELAKVTRVSMPAVSRMLNSLEDKECVERRVDKSNRRSTRVFVTQHGIDTMQKVNDTMSGFTERVFQRIDREKMEQLYELASELYDVMKDELKVTLEERKKDD